MSSNLPQNVIAQYKPNTSSLIPVILISGFAMAGFIGYRMLGQSNEQRLVTLAMLCLLVLGSGVFIVIFASIRTHTVELTPAGTVDFVSRLKRDSYARSSLRRVEGKTTISSKGNSRSYYAHFIFAGDGQNEIKKSVSIPIKPDPDLQEFVRQIEKSNPQADTSKFWAWINET
jgi:hypothetical protein